MFHKTCNVQDRERDQKIGEERGSFLKKNFETLTTQNLDLNQSMITFAKARTITFFNLKISWDVYFDFKDIVFNKFMSFLANNRNNFKHRA